MGNKKRNIANRSILPAHIGIGCDIPPELFHFPAPLVGDQEPYLAPAGKCLPRFNSDICFVRARKRISSAYRRREKRELLLY